MYDFVFSDNTIQVFVRVRPPDKDEVSQNSILQVDPNGSTLVLESKPTPRTFSFDHVADIDATQVNIKIHCKTSLRANPPPELSVLTLWQIFTPHKYAMEHKNDIKRSLLHKQTYICYIKSYLIM